LKTDITQTSAMVPTATPAAEIPEMTLMVLCDFFEKRYRLATHSGNFNEPDECDLFSAIL